MPERATLMTTSLSDWIVSGVRLGERGSRSAARRQPGHSAEDPTHLPRSIRAGWALPASFRLSPLRLDGLLVHARLRIAEVDVPVEVEWSPGAIPFVCGPPGFQVPDDDPGARSNTFTVYVLCTASPPAPARVPAVALHVHWRLRLARPAPDASLDWSLERAVCRDVTQLLEQNRQFPGTKGCAG